MAGYPERTTTLRDGTRILLREARPEDADLVRLGFEQLSDRSRHFRFLRAMPRLSDDDLSFLSSIETNEVIGAMDLEADPPVPAGMARYIRLPGRAHTAEIAITVIDRLQGRGLGSLLFGCLAWQGVQAGLEGFVALVHRRNHPMLDLLEELGARIEDDHGDELQLFLPLSDDPSTYPRTPAGDAFRAAYALAESA